MSRSIWPLFSLFLYLSIFFIKCCLTANILMLSDVPSKSHSIWNQKLARLLADRNHHVTIVDSSPSFINHKNVTHFELPPAFDMSEFDLNFFSGKPSPIYGIDLLLEWMQTACEDLMKSKELKVFLEKYQGIEKPFDLIIRDGGCCENFLGFVERFGSPPFVEATAFGAPTYLVEFAGNYDNPAYVPYAASPFISKMNFMERVENTIIYLYHYYRFYIEHINGQNRMTKEFFGKEISDVLHLSKKATVTMVNIHPAIDGVKPLLPGVIPIGGFHIDPAKPLEKDIQAFLDSSKTGAVYVSFGSNLKCENMDDVKFNLFIQTFRELNHNVLWKCARTIPNLPKNLYLAKWFSQSDVLGHPNVKVFISHGGLLGTQEAVYHGVPIIVLPFIVDQHFIARRLEKLGVAITMSYSELTVNSFKNTINRLFAEQSFQARMKERSVAFRDNPIPPKDLVIFWIEYALRHPNTKLLHSETQTMPIYQILLLDVIGFFILIFIAIILIFIFVLKMLFKICRTLTQNKVKTS